MKRAKRSFFTLVEVTLAMGISVVALVSLTSMLPVGIKNSRDAISLDMSASILKSFVDLYQKNNPEVVAMEKVEVDTTAADYSDERAYLSEVFGDNIVTSHNTNPQLFRFVVPIYDSETGDVLESDFVDFDGEIRIWAEQRSNTHTGVNGLSSRVANHNGTDITMGTVNNVVVFELSWPLSDKYAERKKALITREGESL